MRIVKAVAATATALACYILISNKKKYFSDNVIPPKKLLLSIIEKNKAYAGTKTYYNSFLKKDQDIDFMQKICKYGIPGTENIMFRDTYVMSYSYRLKQPNWTLELLTKDNLSTSNIETDRSKCVFAMDPDIPSMFTARNEDYKNSGYQRGHLVAAGNHRNNQENMCMTFLMSNISPQVGKGFNNGIWSDLENYTRSLVHSYEAMYIVTGPLFLPRYDSDGKLTIKYEVIGSNHVSVPSHYFKVILGITRDGKYEVQSFVIPNEALPTTANYSDFIMPLFNIEMASGLVFFEQIDRNEMVQFKPENKNKKRQNIRRNSSSTRKKNDEPKITT